MPFTFSTLDIAQLVADAAADPVRSVAALAMVVAICVAGAMLDHGHAS